MFSRVRHSATNSTSSTAPVIAVLPFLHVSEALEPAVTAPNLSGEKISPAGNRPASSRPLRFKFSRLPGPPLRSGRQR